MNALALNFIDKFGWPQEVMENFDVTERKMKMVISRKSRVKFMEQLDFTAERFAKIGHITLLLNEIREKLSGIFELAQQRNRVAMMELDDLQIDLEAEEEEEDNDLDLGGLSQQIETARDPSSPHRQFMARQRRHHELQSLGPHRSQLLSQSSVISTASSAVSSQRLSGTTTKRVVSLLNEVLRITHLDRQYRITEHAQMEVMPVTSRKRRRRPSKEEMDEIENEADDQKQNELDPPSKKRQKSSTRSTSTSSKRSTKGKSKKKSKSQSDGNDEEAVVIEVWKFEWGTRKGQEIEYDALLKGPHPIQKNQFIKHGDFLFEAAQDAAKAKEGKYYCPYRGTACMLGKKKGGIIGWTSMQHHGYLHALKKDGVGLNEQHEAWDSKGGCTNCDAAVTGEKYWYDHIARGKKCHKKGKLWRPRQQKNWAEWVPASQIAEPNFSKVPNSVYCKERHDPSKPMEIGPKVKYDPRTKEPLLDANGNLIPLHPVKPENESEEEEEAENNNPSQPFSENKEEEEEEEQDDDMDAVQSAAQQQQQQQEQQQQQSQQSQQQQQQAMDVEDETDKDNDSNTN